MIPRWRTTLGITGHRPVVGHLEGHEVADVCGALNLVTGPLTTRLVEHRRPSRNGSGAGTRRVRGTGALSLGPLLLRRSRASCW
jgi:hypothetical protein